jgi:hypothetical protein
MEVVFFHSINPAQGELYSWRRKAARAFEKLCPDDFDLFRNGWEGLISLGALSIKIPATFAIAGAHRFGFAGALGSQESATRKIPVCDCFDKLSWSQRLYLQKNLRRDSGRERAGVFGR